MRTTETVNFSKYETELCIYDIIMIFNRKD